MSAGGPTLTELWDAWDAEVWADGSDVDHVMAHKLASRGYVRYDVRANTVRVRRIEISTAQEPRIVGVVPVAPHHVEVEGRLTEVVGLLVRADGSTAPLSLDASTV